MRSRYFIRSAAARKSRGGGGSGGEFIDPMMVLTGWGTPGGIASLDADCEKLNERAPVWESSGKGLPGDAEKRLLTTYYKSVYSRCRLILVRQ